MCSYCLFALGPFKMPFWNMPFDKHIIGQVPAVIRAHFNVSKLESKRGALGPAAIHSPLPSPLDIPFLLVHWGEPSAETQILALTLLAFAHLSSRARRLISRMNYSAGSPSWKSGRACWKAKGFCVLSHECDSRTALCCLLITLRWPHAQSITRPRREGFPIFRKTNRKVRSSFTPVANGCHKFVLHVRLILDALVFAEHLSKNSQDVGEVQLTSDLDLFIYFVATRNRFSWHVASTIIYRCPGNFSSA